MGVDIDNRPFDGDKLCFIILFFILFHFLIHTRVLNEKTINGILNRWFRFLRINFMKNNF